MSPATIFQLHLVLARLRGFAAAAGYFQPDALG
jgi:hypothetical protein